MIGIVVVTHGQLARELVAAAEMIVGDDIPNATAVSVGWFDAAEEAQRAIVAAVDRVSAGEGVVLLTDMFGGTPSNLALSLLSESRVEVVTGVNLPMLIRLVSIRAEEQVGLAQAAQEAVAQGKENIYRASELLAGGLRSDAGGDGPPGETAASAESRAAAAGSPADGDGS